jgi:hypothetical protein
MRITIEQWPDPVEEDQPETMSCEEQKHMFAGLAEAIKRLVKAQSARVLGVKQDGQELSGPDEQIAAALRAWKRARQAYMHHLRVHGC